MKKVILIIGVILTAGFSSVRAEVILDTLDGRKLTFGKAECVNLTGLAGYYFDSDIKVILRIDDYWKSAFKEICGQLKREGGPYRGNRRLEEPEPASAPVEVNTFLTVINEGGRASSDSIAGIMNKINEKNLELVFCFNCRADAEKAKKDLDGTGLKLANKNRFEMLANRLAFSLDGVNESCQNDELVYAKPAVETPVTLTPVPETNAFVMKLLS